MRWAMRSIGFINVIILARLLTPEAFGLVAMATIVIGFTTSFTQMGAQQLLIREQDVDADMINTAWTIQLLQGLLIALLLIAISPLAANYFSEPRLVAVIAVLALSCVVDGFFNIGVTLARKELDFALDFRANVYTRLTTFFITLSLVLWLRDYWALVYGKLLGSLAGVIISFAIHPYRPRICLTYFGKYLKFSYAILPLRVSRFLNEKVDAIVVGGIASVATLGIYNVAGDLAKMFTNEIAAPLGRGLMPGYAKIAGDPQALATAFSRVLAVSSAVILPVGVGLCLVAEYLVPLMFGDQWLEAIPYVRLLSLYATLLAVQRLMSTQILIVAGHEARAAILSWVRLAMLLVATLVAAKLYGPMGVAMACPLVGLVSLPVTVGVLTRSIAISVRDIMRALWRPTLSAFVMAAVLQQFQASVALGMVADLVLCVALGGAVYALCMAVTWLLSGREEGIEYITVKAVKSRFPAR